MTNNLPTLSESIKAATQRFMDKWVTPEFVAQTGEYWSANPSRVYWCLIYDLDQSRRAELATDLLATWSTEGNNASFIDAAQVLTKAVLAKRVFPLPLAGIDNSRGVRRD